MNSSEKTRPVTYPLPALFLCVLSIVLSCGMVDADVFRFINAGRNSNWIHAENWRCETKLGVPDADDEVRIGDATVEITTAVTVGYLKNGVGGAGEVIIDGGSLLAAGKTMYNSASYNRHGDLTIKNGGSATFSSYFMVGLSNTAGGSVTINRGTLRVAGIYYHNKGYEESGPLDTRTTINPGGVLEAEQLMLQAGVMNIAGGTVLVRRASVEQAAQWVEEGRIVAMGGNAGWEINATKDPDTGWLVMVAEPPPGAPTHRVDVAQEQPESGRKSKWIIGLVSAGLFFLISTFLYNAKKRAKKRNSGSDSGSSYEF